MAFLVEWAPGSSKGATLMRQRYASAIAALDATPTPDQRVCLPELGGQ